MARPVIRVAGVRACGAGYQNAEQSLRILREGGVEVRDLGWKLPEDFHLWKLRRSPGVGKYLQLARLLILNAASAARLMLDWRGRRQPAFVPYPSVFLLWLLSWVPRRIRPRLVADAYISIWDAQFNDRGSSRHSTASRIVKAIEARALNAASAVIVDTQANSAQIVDEFGVDPTLARAWPLAIEGSRFSVGKQPGGGGTGTFTVLFVGTMIPLHGVERILEAASTFGPDEGVRFRLIGDGQLGPVIEAFVGANPGMPLSWVRNWQSLDQIADEIAAADVCLGVFGGGAKAARVLPFKLYMYLASGKATITQALLSTPDGVPRPPAVYVEPSAAGIAGAVRGLMDQSGRAGQIGAQGRQFYEQFLGDTCILQRWRGLLREME